MSLQERNSGLSWEDLRNVLAVAQAGSLGAAARALGVDHSTMFRRIEALESRVGRRLFERHRSGYVPTALGEQLAEAARQVEQVVFEADRALLGADADLAGDLVLATSELLGYGLVPQLAANFCARYPQIRVNLLVSNRSVDLDRRQADVALRATESPPEHLVGRRVAVVRYAVFAPPSLLPEDLPVDLRSLPFVGFDGAIAHFPNARWLRTQLPDVEPRLRSDSILTLMRAAAAGAGAVVAPIFAGAREPGLVRITAPLADASMPLWLLTHPDTRHNARIRALLDFLADGIPAALEGLLNEGPCHPTLESGSPARQV